ncbi:MAG TPA: type VI secretion system tube protein Hcp [Gammaproteobacteria bacterium]|nr:type VI secretion system tube protein Hcp [Gammaproteobacteria bacterium]
MAIDSFLKIGDLKGESQVKGFENQIQVLAWSWGMSQTGTTHHGSGGGAGKVNVQDLSFTQFVDTSTPTMALACCKGTHYNEATLTMRKAGGEALPYLTIKLTDLIVTSVSTGGSGGEEQQTANVTLNFAAFELMYQAQDNKGAKKGGAVTVKYDIAKMV